MRHRIIIEDKEVLQIYFLEVRRCFSKRKIDICCSRSRLGISELENQVVDDIIKQSLCVILG